jgi:predicted nucleic acid-binding protein
VISIFVSALSFANINYVLLRQRKPEEAKLILRKLKLLVGVLNLDEKIISLSLNDNEFKDFEDALQYYSAIENDMEVIISRNLKDFQSSKLPVMTAEQFIKSTE